MRSRLVRADGAGTYELVNPGNDLALMVPEGVAVRGEGTSSDVGRTVSVMGRTYRLIPLEGLTGTLHLGATP